MIEAECWLARTSRKERKLGLRRFYPMPTILWSAHVVPAGDSEGRTFLINNFVDWDTFNDFYDDNFLIKDVHMVDRYD